MTPQSPQSRHRGTSHSSPDCHQLPVVFSWISLMVWNLFPVKSDFSFGKIQKSQGAKYGMQGAESPGWFAVSPKNSAWDVMHEAANHQLPIAVAFWVTQIVSTEECSSLMQNLVQIHYSTRSVILNATATQCTCSLNGVYRPHWLVPWNCHCSHMHIPWLPGYITVLQTILIILTMVGLFLDRPHISSARQSCPKDKLIVTYRSMEDSAGIYRPLLYSYNEHMDLPYF